MSVLRIVDRNVSQSVHIDKDALGGVPPTAIQVVLTPRQPLLGILLIFEYGGTCVGQRAPAGRPAAAPRAHPLRSAASASRGT